jgi:GT2 family glycosyltransferase
MTATPKLSVVVPVCDAASTLGRALEAILASELPRDSFELIVVDDVSSDGSDIVASRYADTVVRLTGRRSGPAYVRNRGAELASGDLVAFVDADVQVRPDTLPILLTHLRDCPHVDAVSASFDDNPAALNFVSQYWNLLLHFSEERHAGRVAHFSSGCGVVRRSVFVSVGMFDEWLFGLGGMSGLEMGHRLMSAGHNVLLSREALVTSLKRWSPRSVIAEVWQRSSLLTRSLGYQPTRARVPSEIVFALSRTLTAVLAVIGAVALSASFAYEVNRPLEGFIAIGLILLVNFPVHRFYTKHRGLTFAILAVPFHLIVQGVCGMGLCVGWLLRDVVGDRLPNATTRAYAEVGIEMWPPVPRHR